MPISTLRSTAQVQNPTPFPFILPREQHRRNVEPVWVIPDLLRVGGVGCLHGLPGTYKSFLAADAAICIANGVDEFLGQKIEKHGPVLIFAVDDGADTTIDRMRKIAKKRMRSRKYERIVMVEEAVRFLQLGDVRERFVATIETLKEKFGEAPVLVTIDTAAMAGVPISDFGLGFPQAVGWLKEVARHQEMCVLFIDHTKKADAEDRTRDARTGMWGSVLKAGTFEFGWALQRSRDVIGLTATDKRSPRTLHYDLRFSKDGRYDLKWERQSEVTDSDAVLEYAQSVDSFTTEDLVEKLSLKRSTADRRVKNLVESGNIHLEEKGRGRKPSRYSFNPLQ